MVGFKEEEVTVAEDEGLVALTVAVLDGELGTTIYMNLSAIDGTARGIYVVVFGVIMWYSMIHSSI